MEALAIGVLTGLCGTAGLLLWYSLSEPDLVLGSLDDDLGEGWYGEQGLAIGMLQVLSATALVLLGFLTGMVTAFLSSTPVP